jgi:glycosyltransferase involved in cell wall biosynthesis
LNSLNINVIGTRGFPNVQGGVEKHCESLYPLISKMGASVRVFRRTPYIQKENIGQPFYGVNFVDLWTVKEKTLEAVIHSFAASFLCIYKRPHIVHIHNIGPGLVLPLLKIAGLTTVVTYHSPNYAHSKWGTIAKKILKLGELFVNRLADQVIFVSKFQKSLFDGASKNYIPNGVTLQIPSSDSSFLSSIGVRPSKYILAVARFTPEKGLDTLVKAFQGIKGDHKLVIAGDADHETEYSKKLKRLIAQNDRVISTGYITGEPLNQVFSHARLFVLPSFHEGLPIALLEAMSYGLSVLVSDIPANMEVDLAPERYFRCGDETDLTTRMKALLKQELTEIEKRDMRLQIAEKYNWLKIAEQTVEVYRKAMKR